MDSGAQSIFSIRLKLARKMAGMSLQELADKMENLVTKQALSKYEMSLMKPTTEVLLALSKSLNVSIEYFFKQEQIQLGEVLFRKTNGLLKKNEEAIIEKARDYVERFLEIEQIVGHNIHFVNPIADILINSKSDVEVAASKLRESWELGFSPISNIINLLELKGIKILLINDVDSIDGLAVFTSNGIPLIVVNTNGKSIERLRFTIVHELAHLLLNINNTLINDKNSIEKACHYFASCFIIPTKKVHEAFGPVTRDYIAIKELEAVKGYYGISIRALLHRLAELKIISASYYQRWVIFMTKKYGAKEEPGKYVGEEKSTVFNQLVNRALSEGLISISKAASLCNVNVNDLRNGFKSAE